MSNRILKVNQLIKEELAKILEKELPKNLGIITVTEVETTSDLQLSTVWISVYGGDKEKAIEYIKEHLTQFQNFLNKKLILRYVPKIQFKLDSSFDNMERIEGLLKNLRGKSSGHD